MTQTPIERVRAALEAAKHDILSALATSTHWTMAEIENYPAYKKVKEALSELDGFVLVPVEPEMYCYNDFYMREHTIDPREIIGFETESGGSTIMTTRGGLRLENIAREDVVRADIKKLLEKTK